MRAVQVKKCGTVTIITTLFNKVMEIEESDFSQESEISHWHANQGKESSQEETEHLEPWSRIFDEAEKRDETQLN